MKINVNTKLVNLDGEVLKDVTVSPEDRTKVITKDLTLKAILTAALLKDNPQKPLVGEDKIRRYVLATTIHKADGVVDLPIDDVAFVKKLAIDAFGPIVAGQINELLEGKE